MSIGSSHSLHASVAFISSLARRYLSTSSPAAMNEPPTAASVAEKASRLMGSAAEVTAVTDPSEVALARGTAEAVERALAGLAVQGKHEVLVAVG